MDEKITTNKIFIKLALVLIFVNYFTLTANNRIQNSNLGVNQNEINLRENTTVKGLFSKLTELTNYQFFYNENLESLTEKITVSFTNATIEDVLKNTLKNSSLEYQIKGNAILIRKKSIVKRPSSSKKKEIMQTLKITGIVTDNFKYPLPGVNVKVLGSSNGTISNFDGEFSIEAKPEDSLEFSYMGFKKQIVKVGELSVINISLIPSSNTLDEVIISGVAAGTSKKKMSVSVTKIKAADLNLVPQTSVSASLSGKVAGVNITSLNGSPGSGSSITLRGATNLSGSQNPMIFVDGVIMTGSLSDINVDDVESIEVVKGAAASALYGSKAGNGVIVITSKRGNRIKKDKIAVTFRSRFEIQKIAKYLDLSKSHAFELDPNWLDATTYTMYNGVTYPAGYVTGQDDAIVGERVQKYDGYQDLPYRANNNHQDALFTDGLSHTNFIAAALKTDKVNLYLSFEDNKERGIVIETNGYKRNSLRANMDYRFNEKLKFSASNNFIKTNYNRTGSGTNVFSKVLEMEPDVDLFRDNENGQRYNFFPNHWNTRVSNPLYNLWSYDDDSNKLRFLGNYKLKYKLNDLISTEVSYAVESQNYKRISGLSEAVLGDNTPYNTTYNSEIINHYVRATVNLSKKWNDLDFKAKLSYLYEDNEFSNNRTVESQNNADVYTDYLEEIKSVNYFAITSFVYKDRYIFDALLRYDGSSLFGENQRWHPYYRLSGAYRVSEDFPIKSVEEFKLRAAIGTAGQRPRFANQYETFLELSDGSLIKDRLGNKDLKPSKSTEIEIGLDVSFLNRFTLEATYSNTSTIDQVVTYPLAAHAGGFVSQTGNVGSLKTKTFEASLQTKILTKENVTWNFGLTFDKTTSDITKLDIPSFTTGPLRAFRIEDDGEYGNMYGLSFVTNLEQMAAQLPTGDNINNYEINRDGVVVRSNDVGSIYEKAIVLLNDDGTEKQSVIGNITPDFRMGFTNTIRYKNFSFYMLWKLKSGGQIYNYTAQRLVQAYRHPMMDQRFTKPEDKKTVQYYQTLYDRSRLNAFWVEDASYVRLNEASIYYNFKPKKYIENVKFGITGRNLYTFTDYSGYDPEAGYSGYLFDNYGYPNFRSFTASLELKF